MLLFEGIIAGLTAGILMGLISHAGFNIGIFKSSLFIIDGNFIQDVLKLKDEERKAFLLGIPVHLFTSVSFGIGYTVLIGLLKLNPLNGWLIALYTFLLWLSMLFVAFPVAGQGVFEKKIGLLTWLEQLILHIIFGISLWFFLCVLN